MKRHENMLRKNYYRKTAIKVPKVTMIKRQVLNLF